MTAASASDPQALACALAARYAGRWARSVARAGSGDDDAADAIAPWFIDGFAGADLQRAALRGITIKPAATLAVQALDEAAAGRARIVLIEEDPGLIARLGEELEGIGAGDRVRASSDPASAEPGEIVLVEAAFASHAHRLAAGIGGGPALVRLAPLAARTLPWTALQPFASLHSADVLLRLPREDFEKQARFTSPLADLPPHVRRVVEGCSQFLGDARHGWLLAWRQAQRSGGPDAAVTAVIERMQALLASADAERFTPTLRIEGKGEPVHLLLSTPHAGHPLELNGALAEGGAKPKAAAKRKAAASPRPGAPPAAPAEAPETPSAASVAAPAEAPPADPVTSAAASSADPPPAVAPTAPDEPPAVDEPPPPVAPEEPVSRSEPGEPPAIDAPPPPDAPEEPLEIVAPTAPEEPVSQAAIDEPAAVLDLFALDAPAFEPEPEPRGPDLAAFGDDLYARHAGTRMLVRELLASVAESGLAPEQVRAALASLKRAGRASYRSLDAEGAEVEFLAEPRVAAPRPRKPRKSAPDVLGLFDEPED